MNTDRTIQASAWDGSWWGRKVILPLAGVALLGVGVAFQVWAAFQPATFGWFAYAPLSDTRFNPNPGSELGSWGAVLTAVGLVVLAFWAGLFIGERHKTAR